MENPEPRAQYLNVVLRHIERTALRIPRFQRHFVWDKSDVLDLLESIKKGYPIGSILTWKIEGSDVYFSGYREDPFPAVSEKAKLRSFEVILDGAQRLSSLYGCLKNPTSKPEYKVYYDVVDEQFIHDDTDVAIGAKHVPMSSLFDSRRFLAVQSAINDVDETGELLPRALDLYSTFQDYQIPIISLSNAQLEDVVEVFRRINSSGTPLSTVDFVRALTWQSKFDLEDTFSSIIEEFQGTPLHDVDEEFLIRCLAIAAHLSLDPRDILRLKNLSDREAGLAGEVQMMRESLNALSALLSEMGIRRLYEIPYEAQRVILFGLALFGSKVPLIEIQRWLWRSTFAEEHQSKPESYLTRLVREMREGRPSAALAVKKSGDKRLFSKRPRRSNAAVTAGFDLLLRKMRCQSLISGESIDPAEAEIYYLFTAGEVKSASLGRGATRSVLSNVIFLSTGDGPVWNPRGRDPRLFLSEMYELCEKRTGRAQDVWASQGLVGDFSSVKNCDGDLSEFVSNILIDRSEALYERAIS